MGDISAVSMMRLSPARHDQVRPVAEDLVEARTPFPPRCSPTPGLHCVAVHDDDVMIPCLWILCNSASLLFAGCVCCFCRCHAQPHRMCLDPPG